MKTQHLSGLITAAFTPLRTDGTIDWPRLPAYADWLVRERVDGVFVNGTTGEAASLTLPERMQLVERWHEALAGRLPVVVHVGHTALGDAQALARHAEQVGVAGIAALTPFFFRPAVRELVAFCREVAAAAPNTPFYYYHIPSLTGVNVPVATFHEHARSEIPTLAGVKFTSEDLLDVQNALRADWNVLFGRDEILLAALALGCTGAIGSTYNVAALVGRKHPPVQRRAAAFITVMIRHGGLPALKAMMKMIGMDCGPPRLPLRPLGDAEAQRLEAELRQIGFFEWARA